MPDKTRFIETNVGFRKERLRTLPDQASYCGFECPKCGFRRLLTELALTREISELFANPSRTCAITCPECDNHHEYRQGGLKRFIGANDC